LQISDFRLRILDSTLLIDCRLLVLAALLLVPGIARAERATSPADATVFVRLVGSVHIDIDEAGIKRTSDLDHVEIGTGSGFVISPYGYVLTNEHVVSPEPLVVTRGMRRATLTLKVSRVDVCFPRETLAVQGLTTACSEASVAASDPAVDLAVLFISVPNLPYLALGDSDAATVGVPVDALGYPFGRDVEVGKVATAPDLVPEVSITPGAISAVRTDDAGARRYLQVTNSINPGNSGGPLVDRDGFVLGVIRMKLAKAADIGFAIAINEVKDFLESHGLDQALPSRRLRLGPFHSLDTKAMGLRLPEGLADTSPFRSHVETDARVGELALRIDRVLSPWNPKQIEQTLVGTQAFERAAVSPREAQPSARPADAPVLVGHAGGVAADGQQEIRMDYAVLDLGPEKLVARYVGPAEHMAFNASVLRDSLTSLEGHRLVAGDPTPVENLRWATVQAPNGRGAVPVPEGWIVEPSGPTPCSGVPQPSAVIAAFSAQDFTIGVRAAVWSGGEPATESSAAACSPRRGALGAASYATRVDWLGVSYEIDGAFLRLGSGQVLQLEVVAPDQKSAFTRALLDAWLKKATEGP
jgi:S1-C subfamily serine protease